MTHTIKARHRGGFSLPSSSSSVSSSMKTPHPNQTPAGEKLAASRYGQPERVGSGHGWRFHIIGASLRYFRGAKGDFVKQLAPDRYKVGPFSGPIASIFLLSDPLPARFSFPRIGR